MAQYLPCADEIQAKLHTNFQSDHFLGSAKRADLLLQWVTCFKRNLDLFAKTYLGINLHWYQSIILHLMGTCVSFCWIAARAAAKSFIIALYACCMCILYPGYKIVICSGSKGQSKLIVTEKIRNELMNMSPVLRSEILNIKDNQNEIYVYFHNGSQIRVCAANENARGTRSNCNIYEEFRLIDKRIIDSVISPFLVVRQPPYLDNAFYSSNQALREEPKEIYISSAWMCSHWMWPHIKSVAKDMMNGGSSCVVAMDYSITLRHGIKTRSQMIKDKRKFDPMTWMIEYQNCMLRENVGAYFTFAMLNQRQILRKAFYPRRPSEKKVKNKIEKIPGEIRIVSCDIAMVDNTANDNSVYLLQRLLPDKVFDAGEDEDPRVCYRIQVPYLEALRGTETEKQAIRIKQLFTDFEADYCVLDCRNAGISVADALGRVLYDSERDVEYKPWVCINKPDIEKRVSNPNAEPVLYAITASGGLNSSMAINMRSMLVDGRVDLLLSQADAIDEMRVKIPEYLNSNDPEVQLFYEKPYLETMCMINEMANLQYEKLENTGGVRLKEKATEMKDRYTAISMGCYFASELELDMIDIQDNEQLDSAPICVSYLKL